MTDVAGAGAQDIPIPTDVPEEVRESFLIRLKAALRGDQEALAEVQQVLASEEAVEADQAPRGIVTRAFAAITGTAGQAWATVTQWGKLRSFVVGQTENLIIETLKLAFQSILTVPIGVKFTGDTAVMGAFQVKAILYHLNGIPIPEEELASGAEYREEAKRIASYLTTLGIRAGLFALPGIGALAAATVGKFLEGKVRASFGDHDPAVVSEIKALIP